MSLIVDAIAHEATSPAGGRPSVSRVIRHPAAIVMIAGLTVAGVVLGGRQGIGAIPRYRSQVLLTVQAALHTPAQASVVATGADVVVKRMLASGELAAAAGTRDWSDLAIAVVPAGADRIRVEAEHWNPEVTRRAAEAAARQVATAADTEREYVALRSPATSQPGDRPAHPSANPHLFWAREQFEAYSRRLAALPDAKGSAELDALLLAVLERGADAGRQALAVQPEVARSVQLLEDLTQPWFAFPLRMQGAAPPADAVRTRPIVRMAIGGGLSGAGSALLIVALVATVRGQWRRHHIERGS
jgi:hypothetical protein